MFGFGWILKKEPTDVANGFRCLGEKEWIPERTSNWKIKGPKLGKPGEGTDRSYGGAYLTSKGRSWVGRKYRACL